VRVSGLSDERDGLVRNTTAAVRAEANKRMNDRDRKALRFQAGIPDLLGARFNVTYERVEMAVRGFGWELDRVPEQVRPFYLQFDPNTDFDRTNFVGSVDAPEFNRNKIDTIVADASYDLGGWRIDALAGHSLLTVRSLFDNDFGPPPMLFNTTRDDNPQTTAEVRLNSPSLPGFLGLERVFGLGLGNTRFTTGLFFQHRRIDDSKLSINFNVPVLAQFLAANNQPEQAGGVPTDQVLLALVDAGLFDMGLGVEETTMFFNQTTNSFAGFVQLDWELVDRWTLEYGMRFTDESKKADWNRVTTEGTGVLFPLLGGGDFTAQRNRSEFAFTPKIALRHDLTDEIKVYATWGKGFKAGGFNEIAFDDTDDALEYKAETTTAWELGTKMRLLGGAAAVNLGLFRQTMIDFQVLTLPPASVATTVVNAGEALSQGVEFDAMWLATPWLTLFGTVGFNDTKFVEFLFGQCSFDQEATSEVPGRCDHKGRPMFRTPKWITTLVGNVRYPVSGLLGAPNLPVLSMPGLDLIGGGTFEYQDVQFLERTFDPRVRQSPFFRFGGNIGFGNEAQGWSLRLNAENLTNKATAILIRDVPLGGGVFARLPEPPRLLFATFQYAF
jgi:iron complex outermembrane recepter protein